jgi:hypothetical protein
VPRAADRTYGVAAILWPSKKFAEDELIPSGAASIDGLVSDAALLEQVDNLKSALADPGTDASLEEIKPLLAQLEDDPAARRAIVETIRGVVARPRSWGAGAAPPRRHPSQGPQGRRRVWARSWVEPARRLVAC